MSRSVATAVAASWPSCSPLIPRESFWPWNCLNSARRMVTWPSTSTLAPIGSLEFSWSFSSAVEEKESSTSSILKKWKRGGTRSRTCYFIWFSCGLTLSWWWKTTIQDSRLHIGSSDLKVSSSRYEILMPGSWWEIWWATLQCLITSSRYPVAPIKPTLYQFKTLRNPKNKSN